MGKKIWIMNHYSIGMFFSKGGRHYWMAEQLRKDGYDPVVFGCNCKNDKPEMFVDTNKKWCEIETESGVKYIAIRSSFYVGNGLSRVKNMMLFACNLVSVAKEYAKKNGYPDLIYASSVHPLTVLAGEKLARVFKVPCIGEVRDLWPETLVAYGAVKRESLLARLLYRGEYYMYKRSDAMVFTMEGAPDYIKEHKWDVGHGGKIDLNRVFHICNGVDLKQFDSNSTQFILPDNELDDPNLFCATYTGAIKRANNVGLLLDAAEYLRDLPNLRILIWGDGNELEMLKERVQKRNLEGIVIFKGRVEKRFVPAIVKRSDVCLMHWERTSVNNYGYDYNKLFDYLASGHPVFSTIQSGHSLLVEKNCGIETDGPTPKDFAAGIRKIYNMSEAERNEWGIRARLASVDYDFVVLTRKLEKIVDLLLDK